MINNDVANQLQLLIKAVAPPLIEVADTPLEAPQWVPGQRLQAVVLASLPNERFQVLVSDHELDMNLPRNTQPGDKLELTFVSAQPRPTFVLTSDLPQPQGVQSDAKLSQAARFLGALLRGDVPAAAKDQAGDVARAMPILSGPPNDVPELAGRLGKALSQSGLFYESHQAQWVAGQRPLAQLLQEPQGQLSPRLLQGEVAAKSVLQELTTGLDKNQLASALTSDRLSSAPAQEDVAPKSISQAPASGLEKYQLVSALASDRQPVQLSQGDVAPKSAVQEAVAGVEKNQLASALFPGAVPAREQVHPQTTGLVQQQLEVLDGRHVVWQGQVWPGQSMEWRIEERDARREENAPGGDSEWQTSLRLQMPRLGNINAVLGLTPKGVQLKLTANASATAAVMKDRQEDLRKSMEASGLKILSFAVDVANG